MRVVAGASVVAFGGALVMLCAVVNVLGTDMRGEGEAPGVEAVSLVTACTPVDSGGTGLRAGVVPNGWSPLVLEAAAESGVSPAVLAAQVEAESGWNPAAVSPVGAQGLAQFMPGTWAAYGIGDPFDPVAAIAAQGRYMGVLRAAVDPIAKRTGGSTVKYALAAYNAGPGRIEQYQGIPPFTETQNYVRRIVTTAQTKFSADCEPANGQLVGPGRWVVPLPGAVVTSEFGPRWGTLHAGIDLSTPGSGGGVVTAPIGMRITWAGARSDGYGWSVVGVARDGSGYTFRFAHMVAGSVGVVAGQVVGAGARLGTEGATGDATGPHLHFEIFAADAPAMPYASNATPLDPRPILTAKGVRL